MIGRTKGDVALNSKFKEGEKFKVAATRSSVPAPDPWSAFPDVAAVGRYLLLL